MVKGERLTMGGVGVYTPYFIRYTVTSPVNTGHHAVFIRYNAPLQGGCIRYKETLKAESENQNAVLKLWLDRQVPFPENGLNPVSTS